MTLFRTRPLEDTIFLPNFVKKRFFKENIFLKKTISQTSLSSDLANYTLFVTDWRKIIYLVPDIKVQNHTLSSGMSLYELYEGIPSSPHKPGLCFMLGIFFNKTLPFSTALASRCDLASSSVSWSFEFNLCWIHIPFTFLMLSVLHGGAS